MKHIWISSRREGAPDGSHEPARGPRTINQIQQMVDWQTPENSIAQPPQDDQRATESTSASSSSKHEATQHGSRSLSKHRQEHQLFTDQFERARIEVGRNARELIQMVLQARILEDGSLPELHKAYKRLVGQSTELFDAIVCKMVRIRTKIDLSSPVTPRVAQQPQGGRTHPQTARLHRQSGSTQQLRSSRPGARDKTSSQRYHNDCDISVKTPEANNRSEDDSQPSSIGSTATWQWQSPQYLYPEMFCMRDIQCKDLYKKQSPSDSAHTTKRTTASDRDDWEDLVAITRTFSELPRLDTEGASQCLE